MDKISADAESERSGESQTRGRMRSPLGRVIGEPLSAVTWPEPQIADVNLVMLRRTWSRLPARAAE